MKFFHDIPIRLWLFLLCIHICYFIIALLYGNIYTVDSYGYLHQAQNLLLHHSWYAEDWHAPVLIDYFSFRPPLYACFIIFCQSILSGHYFILVVQHLISIINMLVLFKLFKQSGFSVQVCAKVLMLVLLFYPAQFIHANLVMTEIIFQSLLLFLFYYTLQFAQKSNLRNAAILALLLSVSLLTKPVIILFSVAIAIVVLVQSIREKKPILLFPFLMVPLVFHLICLQHQHSTGYYHFSSVKPIFHLKYNAKYTLVAHYNANYADSVITAEMEQINAQSDYQHRYEMMQDKGTQIISKYPLDYLTIYIKGLLAFFIDPGRYDLFHLFGISDEGFNGLYHELNVKGIAALKEFASKAPLGVLLLLVVNLVWNVIVLACFIWFLCFSKAPWFLRLMVFVFVGYIAAATGVLGLSRYRVPVYPMLSIAVLFAFHHFYFLRKHV